MNNNDIAALQASDYESLNGYKGLISSPEQLGLGDKDVHI